jgi:hypothetical protein
VSSEQVSWCLRGLRVACAAVPGCRRNAHLLLMAPSQGQQAEPHCTLPDRHHIAWSFTSYWLCPTARWCLQNHAQECTTAASKDQLAAVQPLKAAATLHVRRWLVPMTVCIGVRSASPVAPLSVARLESDAQQPGAEPALRAGACTHEPKERVCRESVCARCSYRFNVPVRFRKRFAIILTWAGQLQVLDRRASHQLAEATPGTFTSSHRRMFMLAHVAIEKHTARCGAGWRASVEELTDIDRPYRGSVSLIPEYAQSNAEFMREQEVRLTAQPRALVDC